MSQPDLRVVQFRQPTERKKRNPLVFSKAITRRAECFVRERGLKRLVFTIEPNGLLTLRPEKSRRRETVTLADCYSMAVKARVARERAEKKARQT